ncbi:protein phosphatase 1 regulatory subunit 12B isoform X4 [Bemisia tabaci]|uniref:protein phosphatase 1 regulatory subunit 12B isoform X4 n=1 Tax=Bemisia tabaci TaxID=7038 RepID=UPI003B287BE6
MSIETRSSSALFKRAEQLKRWDDSETNREPSSPVNKSKKIKFSLGCVFLAACAAGDKDEVLRLLKLGADIDTANVDGLSALHQACIDDNLEMVEFLVENGADINRGDNEGWTPLHATASCGFISIAKYLIEHGANVAAVNNDGDLPSDIAESSELEELLEQHIEDQGIDRDDARAEERHLMLADAEKWLKSGKIMDEPHPKTGATALHVAAAKGYLDVMVVLLRGGADVNAQDFDGWTPLHAAAHWCQHDACELLVKYFCDIDLKNYVGQTALDVADSETVKLLEELRKKQLLMQRDKQDINKFINRRSATSPKRRSSISRLSVADKTSLLKDKDLSAERQTLDQRISAVEEEQPADKVPKVELEIEPEDSSTASEDSRIENKNKINKERKSRKSSSPELNKPVPNNPAPTSPPSIENDDSNIPSWRRPGSFKNRVSDRNLNLKVGESELPQLITDSWQKRNALEGTQEVSLRRTQSFENDENFRRRYFELRAKINAGNSCPTLHGQTLNSSLTARSSSLKEKHSLRRGTDREDRIPSSQPSSVTTTSLPTTPSSVVNTSPSHATQPIMPRNVIKTITSSTSPTTPTPTYTAPSTPTTPGGTKLSPGNIFKNFFKSFVPPVRDEESETQRKAHAKRVRETRRSTQGVTLEEIKSAEQRLKKRQQQQLHQATQQLNNNSDQFMLEDARSDQATNQRPSSNPAETTAETTVTLPLRRPNKPLEDKEQDKENDCRNAQATQAVIQRRRRPKRRSTGVVQLDMDEIDPDRQDRHAGCVGGDSDNYANDESGSERLSQYSTTSGGGDSLAQSRSTAPSKITNENGELDYKKLYEESQAENALLREKLRKTEEELNQIKSQPDKSTSGRNTMTELEKRERRTMERKLSEMEEELKQMELLKTENQRLKDENGALIRVISKLSK